MIIKKKSLTYCSAQKFSNFLFEEFQFLKDNDSYGGLKSGGLIG